MGKVHPSATLMLWNHAGTAKSGGNQYEFGFAMDGTPVVLSESSNRLWTISWRELLDMAIAAGVDLPDSAATATDGGQ
ncbi:hypothetical protein ACNQFN_11330 [Thauera butanivorans]|uniref:hypothetical protein n=1 Tax=Thauera butanivorans TaxID=86174 RepID=UPI003AB1435C